MKVTVKQLIGDDSFQAEKLLIDGKEVMSVCDLWDCPCGYVDYNETIREAAYRELWEESMLNKSDVKLRQVGFNDNPNDNKQNITFRLVGLIDTNSLPEIYCEFSEPDEIENLAWIPLAEIGIYDWAFNHDKLIFEMFRQL